MPLPLMPMSVADPFTHVIPYIMLLAICLVVLLACLVGVPSLRIYKRKRNLAVYVLFILVLGSIVYQTYNVSLGPNYITFSIEKTQMPIYPRQQNHFNVVCSSDGVKNANFNMFILCSNATVQVAGQQDYIQVNDTCIKIAFSFNGGGEETKPVYFTAEANVASIEFYPRVERGSGDYVVAVYLSEIHCNWDTTTHSFAMADSSPLPVP
jgi:hypothetical protein